MLKDKVKNELNRMEEIKVITKVVEPTNWVNPIIVVKKSDSDVRMCLDQVDLNKAVKREHYPLKAVEEVAAGLSNAKVFSILHATSGFYQIKHAKESTWLTTFNTPFGRYKFEHLPFGFWSQHQRYFRGQCRTF